MGLTLSAGLLLFFGLGSASAQDEENNEPRVRPIEAMACTFNEGKGWDDLKKANAAWNAWMDERGAKDYGGFVMSPAYHSDLKALDFVWVGVWRDGNAMGADSDAWITEGRDIGKLYEDVSSCSAASTYISRPLKLPKDDGNDETDNRFVVTFRNCSFEQEGEGVWDDFMAAHKEWNAYADENDIPGSAYLWWPGAGESADADYDFKYLSAWDDHTARGKGWQKYITDGHWRKRSEILGGKYDCDSPRIYNAWVVRRMGD